MAAMGHEAERGRRILRQEFQKVAHIDVQRVAQGDHARKAQAVGGRPVQRGGGHRARLRHQRDPAGRGHGAREAGVDARGRRQHAQAVRADDPHQVRPGGVKKGLPTSRAGGIVSLEAGADHHSRATAPGAELGDDARDGGGGRGDDRQVGRVRKRRDRRAAGVAQHGRAIGVREQNLAREAARQKIGGQHVAHGARTGIGPDQSDDRWREESVQVARAHAGALSDLRRFTRRAGGEPGSAPWPRCGPSPAPRQQPPV